ncbi:MAG TPA: C25 family cysteine peptidase, partial [Leptolinea sp.]
SVSSLLPSPKSVKPVPDIPITKVKEELARVAVKLDQASIANSDHRFPVLVILSLHAGLEKQFGNQTLAVIDAELKSLAVSIGRLPEWSARVVYADDADSAGKAGLSAITAADPWKIKLFLTDLDKVFAKKGEMIGSLLLVGGPEVIPFHRLPNPTDDLDVEVLSDSPYTTRDSNYFVPEWPVSRLPGGKGADAGLLLEQIRRISQSISNRNKKWQINLHLPELPLLNNLQNLFNQYQIFGNSEMFGYTAEIWKRSSEEVFHQINKSKSILSSPPLTADSVPGVQAVAAPVSYFNLHGLVDSAEWYGQRDMALTPQGPDYPVAIKPDDLYRSNQENGIVYSEACYGGHIAGKGEEDSISLKFLATGSACVVGSTSTSYGSVTTPLIGADLLGYHFLKYLVEGMASGEALYHARIDFIQEMQKRQGYLDGEDQKTLISFVMYGNPFATIRSGKKNPKTIHRDKMASEVCPVCTKDFDEELPKRMGDETMAKIKQAVEPYLPGMNSAQIHYSRIHTECNGKNHTCPTSEIHLNSKSHARSGKMVVSISKSVDSANRTHSHFARVTLDGKGKLVKLSVSR